MARHVVTFWIFWIVLLMPAGVWSQTDITLRLDRTEATPSDVVRMTVHVSGSRTADAVPQISGLENFEVTRGGTASQVEIINGRMNSGLTYTYFLQPRGSGTFTLGPAVIMREGRRLVSNRATLVVAERSPESATDKPPVFLEAALSTEEAFVGQQVLYVLKLYHRVAVDSLQLELPEAEHLQFTQLTEPQVYQTSVDGVSFRVLEVPYALLASREGTYALASSRLRMNILQAGRRSRLDDFFNDPFFKGPRSSRPFTAASDPVELVVRALPREGRPSDFSGLVGSFQLESRLEPMPVTAGDSVTLTVQVHGKGNVQQIPDIHLPDIPFVRSYGDQPVLEIERDRNGIGGRKTMKWALVPEKPGQVNIPALQLSYFDPQTETYRPLKSDARILSVLPGAAAEPSGKKPLPAAPAGNGRQKKEIEQVGEDILPIHTDAGSLAAPSGGLHGWICWLVLAGPLCIYVLLWFCLKMRERSPERSAQIRAKNALRVLKKRCREDTEGCARYIDLLRDYLNDRFQLSLGVLTADEAEKIVLAQGAAVETAKHMRLLMQRLENVVYTGKRDRPAAVARELLALVTTLEKEIR